MGSDLSVIEMSNTPEVPYRKAESRSSLEREKTWLSIPFAVIILQSIELVINCKINYQDARVAKTLLLRGLFHIV